jgi:hypothetical protein
VVPIAKRKVDTRPILGAIVVFLIIGAIVFGIYYFAFAGPAASALGAVKASALSQVNSLSSIGTSKATSDAASFTTRIQAAGSQADVDSILSEVSVAVLREQARKELLSTISTATNGFYYSAAGASGTTQVQDLADLASTLQTAVNSETMNTLEAINAYESTLNTEATSKWRTVLKAVINQIADNLLIMTAGSEHYEGSISKENAVIYVDNTDRDWQELRMLRFIGDPMVQVPVLDTFQRTPTLKEGSIVRVYIYDEDTENLALRYTNAVVKNTIYSQSDLGTVSWTLTTESGGATTTSSYATSMWETIKAAAAGNADAIAAGWSAYGEDVMDRVLSSNIGSYTVSVIYVIEVSDAIGEEVAKAEFQQTSTKDVILLPVV